MPYRLVKGTYALYYKSPRRHVGARPDGDSMWFKPKKRSQLGSLDGRKVKYNDAGFTQLRFEGIDALELHFKGGHQKLPECVNARDLLLQEAGFTAVTYAGSAGLPTSVRDAQPEKIEGYILVQNVDPYGRPVAFAFTGRTNRQNGEECYLDVPWMEKSLNAELARRGHAYPGYYTGLPYDLRDKLTKLIHAASGSRPKGLWPVDSSLKATAVNSSNLGQFAIWPKLYRRLHAYFSKSNAGLQGFKSWLTAKSDRNDDLWVVSIGQQLQLDDVIDISSGKIKMNRPPEDLVITPR